MRIFSSLYIKVMNLSRNKHAPRYLSLVSFLESSIFPIPPDVMLAPMCITRPNKALFFASLTTAASVLGGILGYLIGRFAFDAFEPTLVASSYYDDYKLTLTWFDNWGFWAILIAGFSPIPYKIFTISAGVVSMAFIPFLIASFVGRGVRFYLVALLMSWGGETLEKKIKIWIDRFGWIMLFLTFIIFLILNLRN
tara:strand:- start:26183 stop:26767 length:585 start_codon:yes stop_codon:yes gene_type:complete